MNPLRSLGIVARVRLVIKQSRLKIATNTRLKKWKLHKILAEYNLGVSKDNE
jgi:hypothetical protein